MKRRRYFKLFLFLVCGSGSSNADNFSLQL
jgi:hypothetical protein